MSDEPAMSFADLGLVPGRKVTFTVDGDRVVEDPPLGADEDDLLAGEIHAAIMRTAPPAPTFEELKRTVTMPVRERPIAIAATDIGPGDRVEIDLAAGTARRLPDVAQLGVPGCRCGCSDGRRAP